MQYNWYLIFNTVEFDALLLVSRNYELNLDGVGIKDVLVTKANSYGILYDGIFLSLELNLKTPFEFESHAIWRNPDTNDVYLGLPI